MTDVKHTPGPWALDEHHDDIDVYPVKDGPPKIGRWAEVCVVRDHYEVEQRANARLIAAAPDLLSALKDAMRSARKDFKHGPDGDRQHREAYAEQFAAIAKAESHQ